ncbi:MAG: hypothetical protein ACRDRL_17305, partial [Sciscionella sp.]
MSDLDTLRQALLALAPNGPDGFEGLVATALAAFTVYTFRLARSGMQFGRDATTTPSAFAIGMEAKRYDDSPRAESIAGKVAEAAYWLEGEIDLWVLAATCEIGEETIRRTSDILERSGISTLTLDWADRPLPPLAVLLANRSVETLAWFEIRENNVIALDELDACLQRVRSASAYAEQVSRLSEATSAADLGLGALRNVANTWIARRFSDAASSRMAFGQVIDIKTEAASEIKRVPLLSALDAAVSEASKTRGVCALVGDEGVGKTWLVAQWWAQLEDKPI